MLVAGGFAYYSFASRLGKLNVEISKKQTKLDNSEEITRRLARVEQEYTDAQVKLGALEKGVSTKSYVPTLLRQIEDLGKSVNMRVVGVRPQIAIAAPVQAPASSDGDKGDKPKVVRKKPDPYDKLDIDIEVTGKYCDVARFLYKVTSFPKIIAVNSVQITPVSGSSSKGTIGSPDLSVKLGTTAFIMKDPAAKSGGRDQQTANAGSGQS
jgi:Tfp pilus assembly protein PilO